MQEQDELMPTDLDMGSLREFVWLSKRKEELEGNLEGIKKRMAELKVKLSEQFINSGVQNCTVDGKNVYLSRQIWAKFVAGDSEDETSLAVQRLKDHGLGWLVKPSVNGQTLSAWIREEEKQSDLPYDLFVEYVNKTFGGAIGLSEVFDIRAVAANRK